MKKSFITSGPGLHYQILFVCVDALCPSQQFFSHAGMFSCLPGLNLGTK